MTKKKGKRVQWHYNEAYAVRETEGFLLSKGQRAVLRALAKIRKPVVQILDPKPWPDGRTMLALIRAKLATGSAKRGWTLTSTGREVARACGRG